MCDWWWSDPRTAMISKRKSLSCNTMPSCMYGRTIVHLKPLKGLLLRQGLKKVQRKDPFPLFVCIVLRFFTMCSFLGNLIHKRAYVSYPEDPLLALGKMHQIDLFIYQVIFLKIHKTVKKRVFV